MIRNVNGYNLRNFTDSEYVNVSGTTSQTKMSSVLIPGGTFKEGDLIELEAMFTKVGTSNVFKATFEYNTSDSISGSQQMSIETSSSSNVVFLTTSRRFLVRSVDGDGAGLNKGTAGLKGSVDEANDYLSGEQDDLTPNWEDDVYLMCSVSLSSTFDSVVQQYLKVYTS